MTPVERTLRAQLAALTSWGNTTDWTARTAPARKARDERFDRMVIEKHGVLPPAEHAKRAKAYRSAHYKAMALKSARVRRERAGKTPQP